MFYEFTNFLKQRRIYGGFLLWYEDAIFFLQVRNKKKYVIFPLKQKYLNYNGTKQFQLLFKFKQ